MTWLAEAGATGKHERTLTALLERAVRSRPEGPLLRFEGRTLSAAELADSAGRLAAGLAAEGVGRGDRVAAMSENRAEIVELWLACSRLGAVLVPVNTGLRGDQLAHVLRDAAPSAVAVEEPFRDAVEESGTPPGRIWRVDGGLPLGAEPRAPERLAPGDPSVILYTSGTTGPSKGVVCPQAQWFWWGVHTADVLGLRPDDVLHTSLPLFHTNALNSFCQALVTGASLTVGPRFSASAFWERLAEAGATVTYVLGAMISILWSRPPGGHDRAHAVRVALAPATPAELLEPFRERFGVLLLDGWGSTETNVVLANTHERYRAGTIGTTNPGFEAQVVDEDDEPVPDGTPGELVVRAREPFSFALGYFGLPDATVAAWRNLWFHSGDRVVRDPDGSFRFLDRLKDSIRRRGENISSYEVEQVLLAHPDVAAAAVVPAPSELGEDEVLACVVAREGAELDPLDLVRFAEPRLAYFAVPRYVDVLDELPLTPNGKVEKYRLRARGVTETTWDRERAGYRLRR